MASSVDLDITPNGNDDGTAYGSTNRRPKRAVEPFEISGPAGNNSGSSALTKGRTNTVALPLLLSPILYVLAFLHRILLALLPEPLTRPITNLLEDDRKADEILREIPTKQVKLQNDMNKVDRDQAVLGDKMDQLRERIRRMEERRERWAAEAAKIDEAKRAAGGGS